MTLGVGTNDSDPSYSDSTYTTLGTDWAHIIQVVKSDDASYISQVHVWAANDLEAWHFTTGQVTSDQGNAWISGYSSIDPAPYVNYGDATGCPTSYTTGKGKACSYGYYQYDYYWYSWGAPPSLAAPEIYTTSPDNSGQWANISLYAKNVKGATMQFQGPWDENDFHPSELTASQAWSDFSTALTAAGVNANMSSSLEIHCEVSGQCPNA
ncbi:MAG TPA: hypothetical protein VFW17_20560 [Ktedonobacterales bacterium]|nr:hypothetical protein [Ktedonobacterales bacterium]